MSYPRDVRCPSGAMLKVWPAPFVDAKNLYQAALRELKKMEISSSMQMMDLYKELFCTALSSVELEAYVWKCFEKCTYNYKGADLRINKDTFEPIECRDDYIFCLMEVGRENVAPFGKSLYAEFLNASKVMDQILKSPA